MRVFLFLDLLLGCFWLNSVRLENFGSFCLTLLYDVLRLSLQFVMSFGDRNKRTERTNEFIGETGDSQHHYVSEDCIRSGCGTSECGESIGDTTFLRNGERAPSEKTLRDEPERISEPGQVPLAENPVHRASGDLSKTDQGDQPHQRGVFDFCPSRLKCGETVTVEKEIL